MGGCIWRENSTEIFTQLGVTDVEFLDRVVTNDEWINIFPKSRTLILDFWGSDHRVIHVDLQLHEMTRERKMMRLCFEPWLLKNVE